MTVSEYGSISMTIPDQYKDYSTLAILPIGWQWSGIYFAQNENLNCIEMKIYNISANPADAVFGWAVQGTNVDVYIILVKTKYINVVNL